ncbi:MAG: type IV pilus secretin PilQ, partial [Nitrospiraceae bacterium]
MSAIHTHAKNFVMLFALQSLVSCVHLPPESPTSLGETRPLERVGVTDLADRLRVEVDVGRPLTYSLSSSIDPASVTVDLPGLSKGSALQITNVNKPPVVQVIPTEVSKPRAGVQLLFKLSASVRPEVRRDGTRLFIDFPKGQAQAERTETEMNRTASQEGAAVSSSQEVPAGPGPGSAEASGAARSMTRVEIQRGLGEATVLIFGDGPFTYDVKLLNQDRLVVDLPRVVSPMRVPVLPVDHPVLKQIRIGHHSEKIRLVFDLPQPATYVVESGPDHLAVKLSAVGEADRARSPQKRAEVREPDRTDAGQAQGRVRVASPGRVPFPERLAMIESRPRLAQMAPEAKGVAESDETTQSKYVGRRISLDFQQADISNVLRLIAEVSGFNIVVGEGVKAKVTLKLLSVPWDQALDMLLKMNNLGMIREGNIVWIDTLTNIARQQDEEAKVKDSRIKAEDLVTDVIYVQNVEAQAIQTTLRQYLSPRGQLNFNAASNALVVQDTESRLVQFKKLVRELDLGAPQVQIEARIVQADTSYTRSLGIQWGVQNLQTLSPANGVFNFRSGNTGTFGNQQSDFLVNLPAAVTGIIAPAAGITVGRTSDGALLDLRISAGELLGLTRVIAAPKITTLDKREAKIEQGESIPFQTTSLQGTQTTFVDANLTLQVTPQITSRDPNEKFKQVLLKVRTTRNAVGARSNPAGPSIDKREATTQVMVRDGETMVIGGIFVDSQTNNVAGIPYLSRIPVLGWLFKSKTETVAKQELLIFLTPTVVKS